jgi:hypothetical protein
MHSRQPADWTPMGQARPKESIARYPAKWLSKIAVASRLRTAHLISDRKLSGNTVNQMVGALRFFYLTVVLNKPWRGHEMPYPKKSNSSHILQSTTSHAIPVAKRRANTLPQE